ncbi:MAG: hypothetical protein CVU45_08730, partial [Chloroflexi bacterium HGW-Chloroflexi-7]
MTLSVSQMTLAILPEILLVVLAGLLIVISIIKSDKLNQVLGCITAGGIILAIVSAFLFAMPKSEPALLWGGMLRLDSVTFVFRMIFLFGAALTAIFSCTEETICSRP